MEMVIRQSDRIQLGYFSSATMRGFILFTTRLFFIPTMQAISHPSMLVAEGKYILYSQEERSRTREYGIKISGIY
jgi:hypothetical protein